MLKPRVDILLSEYERLKEYEKENQRLNNVLNEVKEYLKCQLSYLSFEYDLKARMLCSMAIVMLERDELKESDK